MKAWLSIILIGLAMLLSGCGGVLLVGAGVGAGAFSYIAGNLTRVYEADYQLSVKASATVMEQLNFKRKDESEDGLKTIIEGSLNDDTPVTIEVVFVDPGSTQIGVRTGYIGNDNLERSEQLHTDIAEELKRLAPPTLKATARKQKISEPRTLQATAWKKKVQPAESESGNSRTLYDNLPPPPTSVSTSSADLTEPAPLADEWPQIQTPSQSPEEQEIMEEFEAIAVKEEDAEPLAAEPDSAPLESGLDQSGEDAQEKQTPSFSTREQDITEALQVGVATDEQESEFSISDPLLPPDRGMDGPEEIKDDQERLALLIPEKKDNIFIYHPESERTIHLGSYGALDEVIAYLDRNPSKRVDIRAYTNSSGDKQRNLALTQKRVFEIRNYLILNGISAERISARGLGENNFPEINQTDRQDSQKLPVEMVIR